jgi:uncharacterized RDD family membrane protein YckC
MQTYSPSTAPAAALGAPSHLPVGGPTSIAGGVIPAGDELASPWGRLGAHLLDGLLMLVTLFVGWLVWSLFTWRKGQSPAKAMVGFHVTEKATGSAASWGRMFVREVLVRGLVIGMLLGLLTLGIAGFVGTLMIFSAYRETLWDKMAGTLVVKAS